MGKMKPKMDRIPKKSRIYKKTGAVVVNVVKKPLWVFFRVPCKNNSMRFWKQYFRVHEFCIERWSCSEVQCFEPNSSFFLLALSMQLYSKIKLLFNAHHI